MIVSWNWLQEYVKPGQPLETAVERLTMTGLNLEEYHPVGQDFAIDLEVTSNRTDCLGHIGVARECSVLFEQPLTIPAAQPKTVKTKTASVTSVAIECPELCPAYIARVIRGVKVGPSPKWLADRLAAIGQPSVNNIVDITNYVLMECGQPLHAFDFDKLDGKKIIVRAATEGEQFAAINHERYKLSAGMCVIADASRPVALGGVMGGEETEITGKTVNLLIETATFAPLSVRATARRLDLHSPSSYRFERQVDVQQLDWASRRCCELILQLAGGELLDGPVIAGTIPERQPAPITLRYAQLKRILGIEIPAAEADRILQALGLKLTKQGKESSQFIAPSWRRDLTREADLIEEVARIHGYDKIPENVPLPLQPTSQTRRDRVAGKVRQVLLAQGFYEAITLSFTNRKTLALFDPRPELPPVAVSMAAREDESFLRKSLIPNLLRSRRENERYRTLNAQLFELAKTFLTSDPSRPETEVEPLRLGLVTGRSFRDVRGLAELLAKSVNRDAIVTVQPSSLPQFAPGRGGEAYLNGQLWGWLGELDPGVGAGIDLQEPVTVAELDFVLLEESASLVPRFTELPQHPGVQRDFNFLLHESVTWTQLAETVTEAAGELLEGVSFREQYRGKGIPEGRKSYVIAASFRAKDRTLTSEEMEIIQQRIISHCERKLAAQLR